MTKFQTIGEIRTAKINLYQKKEKLEREIKLDFEELKESFKPLNIIKDIFNPEKHAENGKEMSPVTLNLLSTVLDLVISKFAFGKTSYIKKFLSSYVIHSTGPAVIQKFGPTLFSNLKTLIGNFLDKKNHKPIYEQSTASTWNEE